MAGPRLGEVVAQLEADRFVGRDAVLDLARTALAGVEPPRIFSVHGPGGVGKSAVLRAIERLATDDGRPVVHLDGRLVTATPHALRAAIAPASSDGSILIVDEVDELAPLSGELRRAMLDLLPASAVAFLAGRRPPSRSWFDEGFESLAASVALRPLSTSASRDLLARLGRTDPTDVDAIVAWAKGYPLALTLAASLSGAPSTGTGSVPDGNVTGPASTIDDLLLERLGGRELAGVDPDIIDVACLAPAIDARLLAAALPGRPTRDGLTQLRSLSIAEPLGTRVTLHRLAREALRSRLRQTDPDRHRSLVLRIAGHLRERALTESHLIALELAELVEDPQLRVGFSASATHYADVPRPGDLEHAAEHTGAGETAWFARLGRWCREQPHHVIAVRRADGGLGALSVAGMASDVPAWAWDDIETGPILRFAEASGTLERTGFMQDPIIFETDPTAIAEVVRVGNAAAAAMSAVESPRYVYITNPHQGEDTGAAPLGYVAVPELDRADDERSLVTLRSDFGPDGLIGQIYGLILAEQQAEAPAGSDAAGRAVLDALRQFHDDAALAQNPLASGRGADAARTAVRAALDVAFGDGEVDRRLRTAIERTYLDERGGHGIAQRELHMSRSSFYRHLQRARQQLASAMVSAGERSEAP